MDVCVCVAIISPKCAWRKYGEVNVSRPMPQKDSLHLQYILWQSQTSIRNVHFFLQLHLRKKKKKKHQPQRPKRNVRVRVILEVHSYDPGGLPRGVRSQVCLEAKRLHGWQIGMHLRKPTWKLPQIQSSCNYIESLRVWIFVRWLHVPDVDFYSCWKFAISVLDYNRVRTLFERAGSEVNPNIRRSKTHTTLMFSLWTCIALFSASPTQDSSDPSVNPKHFTTFFKSYSLLAENISKFKAPKLKWERCLV